MSAGQTPSENIGPLRSSERPALILQALVPKPTPAAGAARACAAASALPRGERLQVCALLVTTLLLRTVLVFCYAIDSDEPQHLHVAWAWSRGMLQYRDVFDNHAPLFHMLTAPLVALVGERPNIFVPMRFAMFPLYVLSVWSVYVIGRELWCERVGWWSAALGALMPIFFLTSLEYRTDDLWTAVWLVALAVLLRGRSTPLRSAAFGVLLGAALVVSMKTTLLLLAIVVAAPLALGFTRERRGALTAASVTAHVVAFIAGFALAPVALGTFFATHGALASLIYCTVSHNVVPGFAPWQHDPARLLIVPLALPLLWIATRRVADDVPTAELATRRAFVFLAAGVFLIALLGCWAFVTPEDLLPMAPLLPLTFVPALLRCDGAAFATGRSSITGRRPTALLLIAMIEIVAIVVWATPWRDGTASETALLGDVLRITRPHDYIMDLKGETVFRRRSFYYVIEAVTKARLKRGLIEDSIPERLVATHTRVIIASLRGLPPRAHAFMNDNYLPIGTLRVAGRVLGPRTPAASTTMPFTVAIPTRYAIVGERGEPAGLLDGTPYTAARYLAAGAHEFRADPSEGAVALIWVRALRAGFSPFPRARPELTLAGG